MACPPNGDSSIDRPEQGPESEAHQGWGQQLEPQSSPCRSDSTDEAAGMGVFGPDMLSGLSRDQRARIADWQSELAQATNWTGSLPVALLDRCWLRLWAVPVQNLAYELPPDASAEAPELTFYRDLTRSGLGSWQAELLCRRDFGNEAWQQALRHHWRQLEEHPHQWTLNRYLALLSHYRSQFPGQERQLPLLVLARPGSRDPHQVLWLQGSRQSMRHTCA